MNPDPNESSWWPSEEEKAVIRTSFVRFIPKSADVVNHFYSNLFARQPEVRPLFPKDMESLEEKMVAMLAYFADHLDDQEEFAREARKLGARHRHYGALSDHYPVVGSTLIGALVAEPSPLLTPREVELWTKLYGLISGLMLSGANESAETPRSK